MSAADTVEFAGTDEELEKILGEFALLVGGWAGRDPRRNQWVVAGGSAICATPNSLPWKVRVAREDAGLRFSATGTAIPWLRAKGLRVATFRRGQVQDYLTTRLRGGGAEKYDLDRLRAPFSPFGPDIAARTMSFAWSVACLLGAMAAAIAASTFVSLFLMDVTIEEIVERARVLRESGGIALPNEAETASIGFGFRLSCALLFGLPVAFFAGLFHGLALEIGAAWPRASWVPLWSFLTLAFLVVLAFWSFLPVLLVLPLALLLPAAVHAGYTLPWAFRRERLREESRPSGRRGIVGWVLAVVVLLMFVPRPATGMEWKERMVLFRDRWLLGTEPGREVAAFYYRYTLYTADPLKRFYSASGRPARTLRTARAEASVAPLLRELDFTIVPDGVEGGVDVRGEAHALRSGSSQVPWKGTEGRERLKVALDLLADDAFRGGLIAEVYFYSWYSVYFLGPLFFLAVAVGVFCPGVSLLFRKAPRRAALVTLGGVFLAAVAGILCSVEAPAEFDSVEAALTGGPVAARHEAAFRLYQEARDGAPEPFSAPVVEALLAAADDPDLRPRGWAVAALGNTSDPRALSKLRACLRDPDFFVRYRAAEGLGIRRDPAAIDDLLRTIRERGWYEGHYALTALRKIDPKRF